VRGGDGGGAFPEYWLLLSRGRRRISLFTLALTIAVAGIVFLMPPTYEATTTLMPVGDTGGSSLLGQFGVNFDELGISTSTKWNSPAIYPEVARSRRVLEEALKLPLRRTPTSPPEPLLSIVQEQGDGARRLELAVRKLRRSIFVSVDRRTGLVSLRVRSKYPQVAADLANALDSIMVEFTLTAYAGQATRNRQFIEGRLKDTEEELAAAEENVSAFHERNLRIGNSPRLQVEEGRLARALRADEEVYLTLRRQHELAKIEERRDVPTLAVVDPATPPVFRSSPRRGLSIAFAFFIGTFVSSAGVVATDALSRKLTA